MQGDFCPAFFNTNKGHPTTMSKRYTYIQHTTHARACTRHTWTAISTEIQPSQRTEIPATAQRLNQWTYYSVSDNGLTLHTWRLQQRFY